MTASKEYTAGWFDSSIGDFLGEVPKPFPSIQVALITCLDSSTELRGMVETNPHLRDLRRDIKVLGNGLILPTKRLLEAGPLFFGFDEVWFFPHEPREPKPDSVSLVGPDRVDEATLKLVVPWMKRNSCSLGLGDRTGLNVIAKVHGLVRYLFAHSVNQPATSRG